MSDNKNEIILTSQADANSLIKVENDTMIAMAQTRPRSNRAVISELIDQIDAYPSFAESVVYAKPIGTDNNGRMQYARGLSIRAAEAIAAAWGNNEIIQKVETIDDDHVRVVAIFKDLQTVRIWKDEGIVSKWYKTRGGKMAKHNDDRFFNIVVKAELSKRVREAIIRSVPPGLRSELQSVAEARVARLLSNETIEKIVQAFGGIGVSLVQLENLIDKPLSKGWTVDDRVTLQGVFTAIKDGETTIAEAFGAKQAKPDATTEAITKALSEKKGEPNDPAQ